jgi:hypothetical protein
MNMHGNIIQLRQMQLQQRQPRPPRLPPPPPAAPPSRSLGDRPSATHSRCSLQPLITCLQTGPGWCGSPWARRQAQQSGHRPWCTARTAPAGKSMCRQAGKRAFQHSGQAGQASRHAGQAVVTNTPGSAAVPAAPAGASGAGAATHHRLLLHADFKPQPQHIVLLAQADLPKPETQGCLQGREAGQRAGRVGEGGGWVRLTECLVAKRYPGQQLPLVHICRPACNHPSTVGMPHMQGEHPPWVSPPSLCTPSTKACRTGWARGSLICRPLPGTTRPSARSKE